MSDNMADDIERLMLEARYEQHRLHSKINDLQYKLDQAQARNEALIVDVQALTKYRHIDKSLDVIQAHEDKPLANEGMPRALAQPRSQVPQWLKSYVKWLVNKPVPVELLGLIVALVVLVPVAYTVWWWSGGWKCTDRS